jgi:hypothetical protein
MATNAEVKPLEVAPQASSLIASDITLGILYRQGNTAVASPTMKVLAADAERSRRIDGHVHGVCRNPNA